MLEYAEQEFLKCEKVLNYYIFKNGIKKKCEHKIIIIIIIIITLQFKVCQSMFYIFYWTLLW